MTPVLRTSERRQDTGPVTRKRENVRLLQQVDTHGKERPVPVALRVAVRAGYHEPLQESEEEKLRTFGSKP